MSEPTSDKSGAHEALDELVDLTFEALRGNVRHVSRVCSESMAEDTKVDFGREIADFWTRAGRDTARAIQAGQEFLDNLASSKPGTQPPPAASAGPAAASAAASSVAVTCVDEQTFGPFAKPGPVQPQALRRRGDPAPSVTSDRITVTPTSVTRNATKLQINVKCGGVPRGMYVGTLMVGGDEYSYNIYIDPQ